jgi:NodT family efflux transporter outer membrane factor (OMF) lipoprotein
LAVCLAAALLLCGCAVKKPPATQQLVKDALPPTTTVPGAWNDKDALPGPVAEAWLKTFADPQLDALVAEVLKSNLDLQAAATRITVAENMVTEAHAQMMPIIGATGAGTALGRYGQTNILGKSKGKFNASSVLAGVSWELDLWGRIRSQTAAARQGLAATQADVQYARESLAAVTAKVWFLATYTRLLEQYAEQNVEFKKQALQLVEVKRTVGNAQDQQVAIAQADLETAQSQLAAVRSSLQQIVRGLEVLLGRYPAAQLGLADKFAALPAQVPAGLPAQLLERRPDILAAEHNVDAAFHLVQSAKAARLPTVSLTGGGGYMTNEILDRLGFRPWIWTAGGNLAAPLYTAGFLGAQVNVAKENQKAALSVYGETILEAFDEVEVALGNERYLREEQQELGAVLENVSRALDLEKTKHDVGQVSLDPVLDLEAAELGAKMANTQIEYELLANRVNLHLALGGSF